MKNKVIEFLYKKLKEVSENKKTEVAHMILCLEENNFEELENFKSSKKPKIELFEQSMFIKINTYDEHKRIIEMKLFYENHITNDCNCKETDEDYVKEAKCCLTEKCHHSHPKLIFKVINNKSLSLEFKSPKEIFEKTKKILGE